MLETSLLLINSLNKTKSSIFCLLYVFCLDFYTFDIVSSRWFVNVLKFVNFLNKEYDVISHYHKARYTLQPGVGTKYCSLTDVDF